MKGGLKMLNRKKIEIAAIVVVVVVAGTILWMRQSTCTRVANERALIDELRAVRMAVGLYLEINKEYPTSLKDLTTNSFTMGDRTVHYLTNIKSDEEGYPIDSFGKRFNYDPGTGRVWSAEKQYSSW